MNPMLKGLSQSQMMNNLAPLKNMVKMIKSAGNPQMMINQMAGQNPQLKQVLSMVQQSGKSPKDLFFEQAKQMGVDPELILKELNS